MVGVTDPEWDAWRSRSLAEEEIVSLILYTGDFDATIDDQMAELVLIVVIGVRPDGRRTALEVRAVPRFKARGPIDGLFDSLIERGLRAPETYSHGSTSRLRFAVLDECLGWHPTLPSTDWLAMTVWQLIKSRGIDLERRPDRADEG